MSFAKNRVRNIGENISKNLKGKYSHKLIDHAKQSAADAFKTASKKAIQKITELIDLTGNKIGGKITKVSKMSTQNNSETTTNEEDKQIINDLRLI